MGKRFANTTAGRGGLRAATVIAASSVFFCGGLLVVPGAALAGDWPQLGRDGGRARFSPEVTGPRFKPSWDFNAGGPVLSTPVVGDGFAVVVTKAGSVNGLRASTGSRLWTFDAKASVGATPAILNGRVFVPTLGGELYALRLTDGVAQWTQKMGGQNFGSPAIVGDALVIPAGFPAQKLIKLGGAAGLAQWETAPGAIANVTTSSAAMGSDFAVVGVNGGKYQAFALADGKARWTFATRGATNLSAPLVVGNAAYLLPGGSQPNLFAVDTASGLALDGWPLTIEDPQAVPTGIIVGTTYAVSSPIAVNGLIVFQIRFEYGIQTNTGTSAGVLTYQLRLYTVAVNPVAGHPVVQWLTPNGQKTASMNQVPELNMSPTPAAFTGAAANYIAVTSCVAATVRVLDVNTGAEAWSAATSGPTRASPVFANGQLFVATDAGIVHAFSSESNHAPTAPSRLSPGGGRAVDRTGAVLSWEGATDTESSALSYQVRLDDDGELLENFSFEKMTATGDTSVSVPVLLKDGVMYTFAVRSRDEAGAWSEWSAPEHFKAEQLPTVDIAGKAYDNVSDAVAHVQPGETIQLGAGTYKLGSSLVVPPGVSIAGAGGLQTIVDGTGLGAALVLKSAAGRTGGTVIEGVTVTGGRVGIQVSGGEMATLRNIILRDHDDAGLLVDAGQKVDLINATVAWNGTGARAAGTLSVRNSIVLENKTAGLALDGTDGKLDSRYNDVSGNGSDYLGLSAGAGDLASPVTFADAPKRNLRLIDAQATTDRGDPADPFDKEPMPNGGRVNLGAYGNTTLAEISVDAPVMTPPAATPDPATPVVADPTPVVAPMDPIPTKMATSNGSMRGWGCEMVPGQGGGGNTGMALLLAAMAAAAVLRRRINLRAAVATTRRVSVRATMLAILLGVALYPARAHAIARVRTIGAANAGAATISANWSGATVAGNLLTAVVSVRGGSATTISVTAGGAPWVLIGRSDTTNASVAMYYIQNALAYATNTAVSFDIGGSAKAAIRITEYNEVPTASVLDLSATATSSGVASTTGQGGSVPLSTYLRGEIALSAMVHIDASATQAAVTGGFAALGNESSTDASSALTHRQYVYENIFGTGAQAPTATINSGGKEWVGIIATFKGAPRYFIGADGSLFGDNTKWSLSSGGPNNTTAPGNNDWGIFDGNSGNCTVAASVTAGGISMLSTYGAKTLTVAANQTLTIANDMELDGGTLAGNNVTVTGDTRQTAGTVSITGTYLPQGANGYSFTGGTISSGTYTSSKPFVISGGATISGGTFNLTGALNIAGAYTKSGGTWNINGGLTVSGTANLSDGALTWTITGALLVQAGATISAGTFSASTGATLSGGTISGGTYTFSNTATFSGTTINGGSFTQQTANGMTVSGSSITAGTFTLNRTLTMTSGTISGGTWTVTSTSALSGGTISAGTFTLTGAVTISNGFTRSGGTVSLGGALTVNGTANLSNAVTWSTPSTLTVGGTAVISAGTWSCTTSFAQTGGEISGGTWSVTTTSAMSAGLISGGAFTFTGNVTISNSFVRTGGTMTFNAALTINGSATVSNSFTWATATSINVAGTATVSVGTFNATTSVNISGTPSISGGTWAATTTLNVSGGTISGGTWSAAQAAGTSGLSGGTVSAGSFAFTGAATLSSTFVRSGGTMTFAAALNINGATVSNDFTWNAGAAINIGTTANVSVGTFNATTSINVSGTAAISGGTWNATTTVNVSGGTISGGTWSAAQAAGTSGLSGGTISAGSFAFTGAVTLSGTFVRSGGTMTFGGALNINGSASVTNAFTWNAPSVAVSGAATAISVGTFNATTSTVAISAGVITGGTFTATTTATITGGTISGITLTSPTAPTFAGGTISSGTYNFTAGLTVNTPTSISGGTWTLGGRLTVGTGTISGGTWSVAGLSLTSTGTISGGTFDPISNTFVMSGAGTISGGTFNQTTASATTISAGTISGGTFTFGSTLAFTVATLDGANVTVAGLATLTSGTWRTNSNTHTFNGGVTVASTGTVEMLVAGGTTQIANTKTFTLNGTLKSSVTSGTKPIIDNAGSGTWTFTVSGTATLNLDGLKVEHMTGTGMTVANGATWTKFYNVQFRNNGAATRHLKITANTLALTTQGVFFDTNPAVNVQLIGNGDAGGTTTATFYASGTAVNGDGAGEAYDVDDDANDDGVSETPLTNGAIITWISGSSDTTGTMQGFVSAALDWSNFTFYGVYVAFNDVNVGLDDVIYARDLDGVAKYSYTIATADGNIIGTPRWDTVNEVTLDLDIDGDGLKDKTAVHILYVSTSAGKIFKLIDNGSALVLPGGGSTWSAAFSAASVTSITSPIVFDANNIYFAGTDGSSHKNLFGVQLTKGANEKTLQKNIILNTANATTAPALRTYSGKTYLYIASAKDGANAHIYRINITDGVIDATCEDALNDVNGAIRFYADRIVVGDSGGRVHNIAASPTAASGFVNGGLLTPSTNFPYRDTVNHTAAFLNAESGAILASVYAPGPQRIYYGDKDGHLYVMNAVGALVSGYPLQLTASAQLATTPVYISGVIAVGSSAGILYFVDQQNGSAAPNMFSSIDFGSPIVSLSYNSSRSQLMVGTSNGQFFFTPLKADPTPASN